MSERGKRGRERMFSEVGHRRAERACSGAWRRICHAMCAHVNRPTRTVPPPGCCCPDAAAPPPPGSRAAPHAGANAFGGGLTQRLSNWLLDVAAAERRPVKVGTGGGQ